MTMTDAQTPPPEPAGPGGVAHSSTDIDDRARATFTLAAEGVTADPYLFDRIAARRRRHRRRLVAASSAACSLALAGGLLLALPPGGGSGHSVVPAGTSAPAHPPVVEVSPIDVYGMKVTRLPAGFESAGIRVSDGYWYSLTIPAKQGQVAITAGFTGKSAPASTEPDAGYHVTVLPGAPSDLEALLDPKEEVMDLAAYGGRTAERTTVNGAPAVLMTESLPDNNQATRPIYSLWWATPQGMVGVGGTPDVNTVRAIAEGIEAGPAPAGPADPAAATTQVLAAVVTAFSEDTPPADRAAAVEDGESLLGHGDAFEMKYPEEDSLHPIRVAEVSLVRFLSPVQAVVAFQRATEDRPGELSSGDATVRFDGARWTVERESFCVYTRDPTACRAG
ncbi:hypothetical protein ACG83_37820 [Frankia sp. R43]|uniref:hypothetical protein n=1 Tax=Frankia sp. R43 TaxID=269536 RepID=UPI0006CA2F06|nr:hypothetical protein [Frankia sp. R43]KPM50795.1 hypothetical protein ACG83_37820 [Frankia sp. R43]